jgi:hypothetical protein
MPPSEPVAETARPLKAVAVFPPTAGKAQIPLLGLQVLEPSEASVAATSPDISELAAEASLCNRLNAAKELVVRPVNDGAVAASVTGRRNRPAICRTYL